LVPCGPLVRALMVAVRGGQEVGERFRVVQGLCCSMVSCETNKRVA
jgi:hypothetical protein